MKIFLLALTITLTLPLFSQDPILTQAYSSGMYLNPALTGELKGFVANAQYRNQWPNAAGSYITNLYGLQKRFDKIGLGTGLSFIGDNGGNGTVYTSGIGLVVSKWFKINDKLALAWGLNSSFYNKVIDLSKLNFSNDIPKDQVSFVNFSSGLLLKYSLGNTGIALSNFTQPNESFFEKVTSRLPIRFTIHNTTNYTLIKSLDFKLAHTIVYHVQGGSYSLNTYFTPQFKWIKLCFGYSFNNSIIAGGGVSFPRFSLAYIYEPVTSALSQTTGGSHEASLSFRFGNKKEYGDKGSLSF